MVAETNSKIPVHLEVIARNEKNALFRAEALDERGRIDLMGIPHEEDRSCLGRHVRHSVGAPVNPFPNQRVIRDDDATGAREDLLAARERNSSQPIADGAGRDGCPG